MILAAILTVLAVIHIYWAAGGTWAADKVTPKLADGQPIFVPGPVVTLAVAALLLFAAAISARVVFGDFRHWLMYAMALAFALRAVGEFRYCGFLKRIRNTEFAYWDTRVYTPLCVVMAALALLY